MATFDVRNSNRLRSKLLTRARDAVDQGNKVITCGYHAIYATRQHENLSLQHPNGGEAKFLENVYRSQIDQLVAVMKAKMIETNNIEEALFSCADKLLSESNKRIPIDTGYLKSSWFIRNEDYSIEFSGLDGNTLSSDVVETKT